MLTKELWPKENDNIANYLVSEGNVGMMKLL